MFDDQMMPYSGHVDVRIWFEGGRMTVTLPCSDRPHYREYPAELVREKEETDE
jgi:hypothetical protein